MQNENSGSDKVVVLVPCRNEEGRIGQVVKSVLQALPLAHVVVINDDSTDNSAGEARLAGAEVLTHPCNLGYGAALETGYGYAIKNGFKTVVQMDGDGQHLATEICPLLEPLKNATADLVLGCRYGKGGETRASSPVRRAGHRFFGWLLFILTGLRLRDPTSGFQALNGKTLELFASGMFPCDYPDSDVILMARMSGIRIVEILVEMHEREGGLSMHSGLKPLYYGMKMLLSMFIALLNWQSWIRWRKKFNEQ